MFFIVIIPNLRQFNGSPKLGSDFYIILTTPGMLCIFPIAGYFNTILFLALTLILHMIKLDAGSNFITTSNVISVQKKLSCLSIGNPSASLPLTSIQNISITPSIKISDNVPPFKSSNKQNTSYCKSFTLYRM